MKEKLVNYAVIVITQVGLTYVYPAFNYVFVNLSPSAQTGFALLLPVLKLLMKNWLSYIVRHMKDYKAEVVIFNVEIFHTLYMACCMQRSNSANTTMLLMAMDFLQAIASIYDVNESLRSIIRIEKRNEKIRSVSRRSSRHATGPPSPGLQNDDASEAVALKSIPLLETVQYLLEKDDSFDITRASASSRRITGQATQRRSRPNRHWHVGKPSKSTTDLTSRPWQLKLAAAIRRTRPSSSRRPERPAVVDGTCDAVE